MNLKDRKTIDELRIEDLQAFAIWEFTNSDEHVDETVVRPIKRVPVKTLASRLVATQVRLANGSDHDRDAEKRGPKALARFLGLPVGAVFPIAYDIRKYVLGKAAALNNTIDGERGIPDRLDEAVDGGHRNTTKPGQARRSLQPGMGGPS